MILLYLIRISTQNQQEYFNKNSEKYNAYFDNNANNSFQEFTMKNFILELESELGKNINEKYDIQKIPTRSPIGYNYFVTDTGYLIWTSCISCWVTQISTLLYDGITPTINIVSEGMLNDVSKSLLRDDMLNHSVYKEWKKRNFNNENYMRMSK